MTMPPDSGGWQDGTYEAGADDADAAPPGSGQRDDVPNPETGAGIGQGEPSSFEPEEDSGQGSAGT